MSSPHGCATLRPSLHSTPMFSHVFVGVSDFPRALAFYRPLMACLGQAERFCDETRPWAGWQSTPGARPLFVIAGPHDGRPPTPGNGTMVAFLATDRETVRRAFELTARHGGTPEGEPGLRPHYHANYYGMYVRDPDGNKLCVVCHDQDESAAAVTFPDVP